MPPKRYILPLLRLTLLTALAGLIFGLLTGQGIIAHAAPPYPPALPIPDTTDPLRDPCLDELPPAEAAECAHPEGRTRRWIRETFPYQHRNAALHIARWESAHTFNPLVCYGGPRRAAGSVFRGDRDCDGASGLFQHQRRYWEDRSRKAAAWWGIPETDLDIWNGWHSTLVARWLIETDGTGRTDWRGWAHFDTCTESDRRDNQPFRHARTCSADWI